MRDPQRSVYRGFIARTSYVPCFADFNLDGGVDSADVESVFIAWASGITESDVNLDGGLDGSDVETFFTTWARGGCVDCPKRPRSRILIHHGLPRFPTLRRQAGTHTKNG